MLDESANLCRVFRNFALTPTTGFRALMPWPWHDLLGTRLPEWSIRLGRLPRLGCVEAVSEHSMVAFSGMLLFPSRGHIGYIFWDGFGTKFAVQGSMPRDFVCPDTPAVRDKPRKPLALPEWRARHGTTAPRVLA